MEQREIDHIFERLRSGLVPERGLEAFAVGIESQRGPTEAHPLDTGVKADADVPVDKEIVVKGFESEGAGCAHGTEAHLIATSSTDRIMVAGCAGSAGVRRRVAEQVRGLFGTARWIAS